MSRPNWLGPVLLGAAVGAGLGYLDLSDDGRRIRRNVEPWLEEFTREMRRIRAVALKARNAMDEGRDSFETVWHLAGGPGHVRGDEERQSPFP
jgi:hypothetical protein